MLRLAFVLALGAAPLRASEPDAGTAANTALAFVSSYLAAWQARDIRNEKEAVAWVRRSPWVTAEFPKALSRLYAEARRQDPGLGWGADAVLASQDPPSYYRVASILMRGSRAVVRLRGEPEGVGRLEVGLRWHRSRWLVERCGDVRPPTNDP